MPGEKCGYRMKEIKKDSCQKYWEKKGAYKNDKRPKNKIDLGRYEDDQESQKGVDQNSKEPGLGDWD